MLRSFAAQVDQAIRVGTAVRHRDPEIIPVIREMTATDRLWATAGFDPEDREWVNTMLMYTDPLLDRDQS
jgi:hypothetical protein